jgi:hypothetical protein
LLFGPPGIAQRYDSEHPLIVLSWNHCVKKASFALRSSLQGLRCPDGQLRLGRTDALALAR